MRCGIRAVVLCIAAFGVAVAAQRPAPPTRDTSARSQPSAENAEGIRGRVVEASSGRPLIKARITLSSDNGHVEAPAFTDARGEFAFVPLPAGRYTILVEKTGFARVSYGARTELDPPIEIALERGTPVENVVVSLTKGAAIFGRITDDFNDPVVGGDVTLSVARTVGNSVRLVPVSRAPVQTNDLGDYRIGDLPPGRYFVTIAAAGLGTLPGGVPREWERLTAWGRTFFPGTTSVSDANTIPLAAGEERGGVDFSVKPFDRVRLGLNISGYTVGPPDPAAAAAQLRQQAQQTFTTGDVGLVSGPGRGGPGTLPMTVEFAPADPDTPFRSGLMMTLISSTSDVTIPNTPIPEPGDWIFLARQGANGAVVHVHLASGDEQMADVNLAPGSKVSGRVIFDGAHTPPPVTGVQITVRGAGADAALTRLQRRPPALPKPDGSFEMSDLFGTIDLDALAPPGWTLKSVMYRDRDLLDEALTLKTGENVSGVEVILSDEVGAVMGSVNLADGSRCRRLHDRTLSR